VKLASAVVKLMAATELLLKEELERICPALVLDKVDDDGLQVAKAFGLAKELINPKQLESVELKTAPFPKLLNRATKFIDLKEARPLWKSCTRLGTLCSIIVATWTFWKSIYC